MSRLKAFGTTAEVTPTLDNAWHTLCMLKAPTHQRAVLERWGARGLGTVNSDKPIPIRLVRCSTDGSATTKSPGKKNTKYAETPQCVFTHIFTAEPTVDGEPIDHKTVHPQTGFQNVAIERGEWEMAGGERLAVQYYGETTTGSSAKRYGDMDWEE